MHCFYSQSAYWYPLPRVRGLRAAIEEMREATSPRQLYGGVDKWKQQKNPQRSFEVTLTIVSHSPLHSISETVRYRGIWFQRTYEQGRLSLSTVATKCAVDNFWRGYWDIHYLAYTVWMWTIILWIQEYGQLEVVQQCSPCSMCSWPLWSVDPVYKVVDSCCSGM